jgi:hypothetical protein
LCVAGALVAELDKAGRGRIGGECAIHTRVVAAVSKKAKEKDQLPNSGCLR